MAQLCHPKRLKPYFRRDGQDGPFSSAVEEASFVLFLRCEGEAGDTLGPVPVVPKEQWVHNSAGMLGEKLSHWEKTRGEELLGRLLQYPAVYRKVPGQAALAGHDIDVGDSGPVKLPPHHTSSSQQRFAEEELKHMLAQGLDVQASSQWSSGPAPSTAVWPGGGRAGHVPVFSGPRSERPAVSSRWCWRRCDVQHRWARPRQRREGCVVAALSS